MTSVLVLCFRLKLEYVYNYVFTTSMGRGYSQVRWIFSDCKRMMELHWCFLIMEENLNLMMITRFTGSDCLHSYQVYLKLSLTVNWISMRYAVFHAVDGSDSCLRLCTMWSKFIPEQRPFLAQNFRCDLIWRSFHVLCTYIIIICLFLYLYRDSSFVLFVTTS